MKLFTLLLSVFLCIPGPKDSIKLDKKFKIEGTFSGNMTGEDSFHLIIAKNTEDKNFNILPYTFAKGAVNELKPIVFEDKLGVLSFHSNDESFTIITKTKKNKEEVFNVIDINTSTGAHTISENIIAEDFKTILRKEDKNILVFANDEELKIVKVENSQSVTESKIAVNDSNKDFLKELSKNGLDAVNTDEFIKNGSIKEFRAYSENDQIIITRENDKEGTTQVLKAPLNGNGEITEDLSTYQNKNFSDKIKKSTSFYANDKLYQLKLAKDQAAIDIFNLDDDSSSSIDLLSSELKDVASNKTANDNFVNKASKSRNEPTITANTTSTGAVKVRMDYVDKRTYNYNNNWWWFHNWMWQQQMMHMQMHQQMLQQQRQSMNSLPRFGPNPPEEVPFIKVVSNLDSSSSFEIGISLDGSLINPKELKTIHRDIDKKSYIDKLEENKKLKYASTVFTDSKFRYIAYNKKTRSLKIIEKELK
ncbi:MAG: hypothetical protein ACSHWW_00870 [Nonlabens sp.]|uniref:hypothetical protein n=1 Tax=Nonlabens sp. TaxID=1888209 RepID=UPI003EFA6447